MRRNLKIWCHHCFYWRAGHVDDKANKLHAIASLRVLLDATKTQAQGQDPPLANGRESVGNEVSPTFPLVSLVMY